MRFWVWGKEGGEYRVTRKEDWRAARGLGYVSSSWFILLISWHPLVLFVVLAINPYKYMKRDK